MLRNWSLFENEPVVDYIKMVDKTGKITAPITSEMTDASSDGEINKKIDDILYGLTI